MHPTDQTRARGATSRCRWVALLVCCCALAGCERGESEETPEHDPGRIIAEGRLGPVAAKVLHRGGPLRFGDRILFMFVLELGDRVRLEPIDFSARLGHFRVRDRQGPREVRGNEQLYEFVVEAERSGSNIGVVPPIRFRVDGEDEKIHELRVPPFELTVAELSEKEVPSLAELGPPLAPLPIPPKEQKSVLVWVAVGGLGLLLSLTALWWISGRRRGFFEPPPIDPEEEAQSALDRLLKKGLVESGQLGPFYVELTGIVRVFVERTTHVSAPDLTTEEFLREMESRDLYPWERRQMLTRFLEAADLVKYAARVPEPREIEEAVGSARSFCRVSPKDVGVAS